MVTPPIIKMALGASHQDFPHSFDSAKLELPLLKIFHAGHLLQDLLTFLPKHSLPISEIT